MMKKIVYYWIKIQQVLYYYRYKVLTPFNHNKGDSLTYISLHHPIFAYSNKPRLPEEIARRGTGTLLKNAVFDAGKSVKFYTSSELLGIKVLYKKRAVLDYMKSSEAGGIEVLVHNQGEITCHVIAPVYYSQMFIKTKVELALGNKLVHIRFPGYAAVDEMYLGFTAHSKLEAYKNVETKPIIFYGSSITQGCAASRPGLSYVHLVGESLKKPILNFGFSESAMGEQEVIAYISRQPAYCFIIEYDHNASVNRLRDTHLEVYKSIRKNNPEIPIIFMSRFSGGLSITEEEEDKRIEIINDTMAFAHGNRDTKVWFLSGKNVLSREKKKQYFVDDRHPNDGGMKLIADHLVEIIKRAGNHND